MDELDLLRNSVRNKRGMSNDPSMIPPDMGIEDRLATSSDYNRRTGTVPYLASAVNSLNRGLTQVAELPYNIVNNAPQLMNLLPGDQGVGKLSEMGMPPFKQMGEDPLIDFMGKYYPGQDQVGGISQPNPEYPITSRVAEDIGTGVGTMGAGALETGATGLAGLVSKYLGKPLMDTPARAIVSQVAGAGGSESGRQVADAFDVQNPAARFALQMGGAMAPGGITDMAETGAKKLFSREGGQTALDAMDRLDIRPSIGLTGNQNAAQLENAAAILPFFGSVAKNVQGGQIDDFGTKLKETASSIRPNGAAPRSDEIMLGEQVGEIAKGGLKRMKGNFSDAEEMIGASIGKDTLIDTTNLRTSMAEQMKYATGATKTALEKEMTALDNAADEAGRVPYQSLRNWRSQFGAGIEDQGLLKGAKDQVYAGVTKDLEGAAGQAGLGDEFKGLMGEQRIARDETLPLSEGGDIPAMESLSKGQAERGKTFFNQAISNPDRVQMLKRNATPQQWQQFAGDTLEHLGIARDSAQGAVGDLVSPNTFLTNWNKMDPRTKIMLFDDGQGTLQTLNDLAIVAEAMKTRGNASNFSNTAGVGMSAGALAKAGAAVGTAGVGAGTGAAMAGIPGAAAGAGITYATVKALMSQTMARWAANQGVPLGEKITTQGLTGAAMAGNDTEIAPIRRKK